MADPNPQADSEEPVDDLDELNEVLPSTYSITSYGADPPVDGLVKRLQQEDIVVPLFSAEPEPGQSTVGFQREYVWTRPQADRFIESLLLGLPVPGIFMVKESNGKHLVLDGQQRLRTLQAFYGGILQGAEYLLEHVQERWKGKTYKTLHADDRRRLDDSIIHATIVRQDEPSEDQSSIYLIFERLNSGGTLLQPQEIRVALYHGALAALLSKLNLNPDWRALYGRKSARLKDLELILRFFAMHFHSGSYRRPMKDFLNRYMAANRALEKQSAGELTALFEATVAAIHSHIGKRAFRLERVVNAAVVDAVMVGVAARLAKGPVKDSAGMAKAYDALVANADFKGAAERATADEENVKVRLRRAREAFAPVQ
ncbi:MAG: DUF262 domain-containing protein [Burkholderiales bacterium]|nr:DUF262 domain-containing protein [Burkholderiales bacterium]